MGDRYFDRDLARDYLFEVADILDRLRVPFFLMQGTALGAYRDKGFTPTERDIDIGVLWEHFKQGPDLAEHFEAAGYDIERWARPFSRLRTLVLDKPGVHVDVVSVALWKDKRFVCSPVHPSIPEPYAIVHDRAILETYQPVELFGRTFNAPSPIELYLRREYGDDWRTPREDHISRTRVYDFVQREGIPLDLLDVES